MMAHPALPRAHTRVTTRADRRPNRKHVSLTAAAIAPSAISVMAELCSKHARGDLPAMSRSTNTTGILPSVVCIWHITDELNTFKCPEHGTINANALLTRVQTLDDGGGVDEVAGAEHTGEV